MGIVDKAGKAAGVATGLVLIAKSIGSATWGEDGRVQTVKVLGIPVFDRRRMEARRAARKAGK